MSRAARRQLFSYAEYLAREQETGLKHEWLEGELFAMAGGSPEHARLIADVTHALRRALDPRRCRVYTAELEIRVAASGLATYPTSRWCAVRSSSTATIRTRWSTRPCWSSCYRPRPARKRHRARNGQCARHRALPGRSPRWSRSTTSAGSPRATVTS